MNKLLPYNEFEIMARIAERKSLNYKIQQEEVNDKRLAFDQFVQEQMDINGIKKELLSNELSREVIYNTLMFKFKYIQTPENITKLANMKKEANEVLPDFIKSEKWSTGDCGCTLHRIYHKDFPEDMQTFNHKNGANCHPDLGMEDLHDIVNEETHRRGNVHRHLHENYDGIITETDSNGQRKNKEGVDIKFTWQNKNKERILEVDVVGALLTSQQKTQIEDFSDLKFGRKLIKNQQKKLVIIK